MKLSLCSLCALLLLHFTTVSSSFAEDFDIRTNYDKAEYEITMRDGVKLHTVVYTPKDQSEQYPILLKRTPYSAKPYGANEFHKSNALAPSEEFLKDGYIFVVQDGRGTHLSGGEWVNLQPVRTGDEKTDETTDAYDTIDWLTNNISGNNGRVGQWGISHPGWYTVQSMIDPHPALKAASPQATTFDPFIGDDEHRNGAFRLLSIDWWRHMSITTGPERRKFNGKRPEGHDYKTPWAYEFFLNAGPLDEINEDHYGGMLSHIWDNVIEHPNYDDFWRAINVERHLDNITVPTLHVAGWFDDPDPYGAFKTYEVIEKNNPNIDSTLVVGPWRHGGWLGDDGSMLGDIDFGSKTSDYFKSDIIFPFFQYYLKNQGTWSPPEAKVFVTGTNKWQSFEQWPPKSVEHTPFYMHEDSALAPSKPKTRGKKAHDDYISDPNKPVPYTNVIPENPGPSYLVADQRFASTRPDVLTYQTDVLEEDITIAGPILVNLFASTTGTDSDWFVKVIDVHPGDAPDNSQGTKMGGYQMLVGAEVMRGKYRNSLSDPEPMKPGKPTPIEFEIRDKFHTFKKGHKIMVQVHSTWFPVSDRNPQTFTNIYSAEKDEYVKATQKIYRSKKYPSHITLPVIRQ